MHFIWQYRQNKRFWHIIKVNHCDTTAVSCSAIGSQMSMVVIDIFIYAHVTITSSFLQIMIWARMHGEHWPRIVLQDEVVVVQLGTWGACPLD